MPDNDIQEVLKRFDLAQKVDKAQRILAVDDMVFTHATDGQWEDNIIQKRANKPRYTINRVAGAVDQLIGDQRQNRIGVKVTPRDKGDEKTAEVLTGLIRSIERQSCAVNAYDQAFDEQTTGGYGGWEIVTDYQDEDTFDQDIKIEPLDSAASTLYFDPDAKRYDKSDAQFAFKITLMTRESFKEKWPDAALHDFPQPQPESESILFGNVWFSSEMVRVADYWYKIPIKRKIGALSDGRVIDLEEEKDVLDELEAQGITVVKTRTVDSHRIEMVVMNGTEFLTEPQQWDGMFIPLIPVFGRNVTVGGIRYIRGIVRMAKDSQRIYNYATSAAIEATALTPKDPYWLTTIQAAGYEKDYKRFNVDNKPFMLYNSDPLAPGPPSRGGAPQLQTALLEQIRQAATDIHATTGLEPASMGNIPELKSGKAIQAQQAMGDRGAFVFQDNLRKSVEYSAQVLVDLITRIYDTERVVQIVGIDDSVQDITLNEPQSNGINQPIIDEETGEQVIVNDLNQGKYNVHATSGPSFTNQREETATQLINLATQSPIIQELALDRIVKNMNLVDGEEIEKRVRRHMIKQGTIEPTDEEKEELGLNETPPPDPMQESLRKNVDAVTTKTEIESQKIIADIENKDADTQQKIIQTQKTSVDALTALRENVLKKLESGLSITPEEIELIRGQSAIVEETQGDVLRGSEVAGSLPLGTTPAT